MVMKTLYQDKSTKVEIPLMLHDMLSAKRFLTPDELNAAFSSKIAPILKDEGFQITSKNKQFLVGKQLIYLKDALTISFTPDFQTIGDIIETLCFNTEIEQLKFCSYDEQQKYAQIIEANAEAMYDEDFVFVRFFEQPVNDIYGFVALGSEEKLKCIFIGYYEEI